MGEASMVALGLVVGLALGAAFFEGLRHTVARVAGARHPALLVLGGFTIRMAIVAALFVALVRVGGGAPLAAATVGLVLARTAVLRRARSGGGPWT